MAGDGSTSSVKINNNSQQPVVLSSSSSSYSRRIERSATSVSGMCFSYKKVALLWIFFFLPLKKSQEQNTTYI